MIMIMFCLIFTISIFILALIVSICDAISNYKFIKNTKLHTTDILNCKSLSELKILIKAKEYELKLKEKNEKFIIDRGS